MDYSSSSLDDWKPVLVKVKLGCVDFDSILVLTPRDGNVAYLQKDIRETFERILPPRRIPKFTHIMKESGKVLLPPWYPIELLLEDNEKVVLSYGCEIFKYDASHGNETSFLCGPNTESISLVKAVTERPASSTKVSDTHGINKTGIATAAASRSKSCRLPADTLLITPNIEQEECSSVPSTKAVNKEQQRDANMIVEVDATEQSGLMMKSGENSEAREAAKSTSGLPAVGPSLDKQNDKDQKRKKKRKKIKIKKEDVESQTVMESQTVINNAPIADEESSRSRKRSKNKRKEKNVIDPVGTEELSDGSKRKKKMKVEDNQQEGSTTDTADRELESKELVADCNIFRIPKAKSTANVPQRCKEEQLSTVIGVGKRPSSVEEGAEGNSMANFATADVTSQQSQSSNNVTADVKQKMCFDDETDSEMSAIQSNIKQMCNEIVPESDYSASSITLPLTVGKKSKHKKNRRKSSVIGNLQTSPVRAGKDQADASIDVRKSPIELLKDNPDNIKESRLMISSQEPVADDKGESADTIKDHEQKASVKDNPNISNDESHLPQDPKSGLRRETAISTTKSKNDGETCAKSLASDESSSVTFSDISAKVVKLEVEKKDLNETKETGKRRDEANEVDKSETSWSTKEKEGKRKKARGKHRSRKLVQTSLNSSLPSSGMDTSVSRVNAWISTLSDNSQNTPAPGEPNLDSTGLVSESGIERTEQSFVVMESTPIDAQTSIKESKMISKTASGTDVLDKKGHSQSSTESENTPNSKKEKSLSKKKNFTFSNVLPAKDEVGKSPKLKAGKSSKLDTSVENPCFDSLLDGGDSVISSELVTTKPMTRLSTSNARKSINGFLTPGDRKRFLTKVKMSA